MATFQCSVVTPEGSFLECEATSAVVPAFDGQVGILPNHAPLLCRLGIGVLQVTTPEGERLVYVDSGFAQVVGNTLTLLTENARSLDELDAEAAQRILDEAHAMLVTDEDSFERRQAALQRARVQQRLTN